MEAVVSEEATSDAPEAAGTAAAASGTKEVTESDGVEDSGGSTEAKNDGGNLRKDGGGLNFNERCTSLAKFKGPSSRVSRSPRCAGSSTT